MADATTVHTVIMAGETYLPGQKISGERKELEWLAEQGAVTFKNIPQLDHDHDGAPGGSDPDAPPALTGRNKAQLLEIAAAEGVTVAEGATNAEIVAAIEAGREAGGSDPDAPVA